MLTPLRRLGFYFTAAFTQNILCSLFSWNPEVVRVHQANSLAKLTFNSTAREFGCCKSHSYILVYLHHLAGYSKVTAGLTCMRPVCRPRCGVGAGCVAEVCVTTSSLPCCRVAQSPARPSSCFHLLCSCRSMELGLHRSPMPEFDPCALGFALVIFQTGVGFRLPS